MIYVRKGNAKKYMNKNNNQSYFIKFDYDISILNDVRRLPNRFWHADSKEWEVPAKLEVDVEILLDKYGNKDTSLPTHQSKVNFNCHTYNFDDIELPININPLIPLYKHQIDAIKFGYKKNNFLLADEMGLGKTASLIHYALLKRELNKYKHCLVICGINQLKWNWQREIKLHSGLDSWVIGQKFSKGQIIQGSISKCYDDIKALPNYYFLIVNIEKIRDNLFNQYLIKQIKENNIDMIIIDEAQVVKNYNTKQTKSFLKLEPKTKVAATGTPIMNNPLELWTLFNWLGVDNHSFYQFKQYHAVFGGYNNYEIVAYKHLDEIQLRLNKIMIRRKKDEVLELPDKIFTTELLELTPKQQTVYNEIKKEILAEVDLIKSSPNPLAKMVRLRQATGDATFLSSNININQCIKFVRLFELLQELSANNQKVIIFSNWSQIIYKIKETFVDYDFSIITGQQSEKEREQSIINFRQNPNTHLIGTTGALGTGFTLTESSNIIFMDSPWNASVKNQAIDRIHRIGQSKTCNIITLVCKNTIDERIEDIIYKKSEMTDIIVENGEIKSSPSKNYIIDYLLK